MDRALAPAKAAIAVLDRIRKNERSPPLVMLSKCELA
jgi:hypothetical protein